MTTILLTFLSFLAAAAAFPYAVIAVALAWPWLLSRYARDRAPNPLLTGVAMALGTAAGVFLRRSVLGIDDEALGGAIVWFIAITLGVLAYGLSTIVLGIHRQTQQRSQRQSPQ